jgi:hypothetical protein
VVDDGGVLCSVFGGRTVSWLTESKTYFVFISLEPYDDYPAESYKFGLNITEVERATNNACQTARTLPKDGSMTVSTTVTVPATENACTFTSESAVWYVVEGSDQLIRASTCHANTKFRGAISVLAGTCDALECVQDRSTVLCGAGQTVDWMGKLGVRYFLVVHGDFVEDSGTFGLTGKEVQLAANNVCTNPFPILTDATTVTGDTDAASAFLSGQSVCGGTYLDSPGLWYSVTGTGKGLSASTWSNETNFDSLIAVFLATVRP